MLDERDGEWVSLVLSPSSSQTRVCDRRDRSAITLDCYHTLPASIPNMFVNRLPPILGWISSPH